MEDAQAAEDCDAGGGFAVDAGLPFGERGVAWNGLRSVDAPKTTQDSLKAGVPEEAK